MEALFSIAQLTAQLFFFFLPAGVANMAPVLIRDHLAFLARPVDGGRLLWGAPLFGSHKTWRGMLVATIAGGLCYMGERVVFYAVPMASSWIPFEFQRFPWWFGFPFALGAITGDLVKSFFKRRFHHAPGKTWFPFDQLDFLFGAAFVASFVIDFTIAMWIVVFLIGPLCHIFANRLGFWFHLKKTPW